MGTGTTWSKLANASRPVSPICPEQKYKDVEPSLKIEEVDGLELVRKFSEDMENMLRRKVEAVKVLWPAALSCPPCSPGRAWPDRSCRDRARCGLGWPNSWLGGDGAVYTPP